MEIVIAVFKLRFTFIIGNYFTNYFNVSICLKIDAGFWMSVKRNAPVAYRDCVIVTGNA